MKIKLRLIEKDDVPQLASTYVKAFNKAVIDEDWTQETAENLINFWYSKSSVIAYIALIGNKIVGGVKGEVMPY